MTVPHGSLRRVNLLLSALHLIQGTSILILSTDFALPVTAGFLEFDGVALQPVQRILAEVQIGPLVALFLVLSALAHLILAAPSVEPWYAANLSRGINHVRWVEYALSSSVMVVVVAMLVGVYDIATLIALFGVNAAMILFGWMMELHNQATTDTRWAAFWFGSVAGVVPWIVIGVYLFGSASGPGGPPAFVIAIYASIFVLFNAFPVNMALQYRGNGRWADYVFGERVYMLLSLTAKSLLAWQVFAGTLRPV